MKEKDKTMLARAIRNSDILANSHKNILNIIESADYPMSAKNIEQAMGHTRQAVNSSLKTLLDRRFVEREKDRNFVYTLNKDRAVELIERYKTSLLAEKLN